MAVISAYTNTTNCTINYDTAHSGNDTTAVTAICPTGYEPPYYVYSYTFPDHYDWDIKEQPKEELKIKKVYNRYELMDFDE